MLTEKDKQNLIVDNSIRTLDPNHLMGYDPGSTDWYACMDSAYRMGKTSLRGATLHPELSIPAQKEAQKVMDGFKKNLLTVCNTTLDELYCGLIAHIENDLIQDLLDRLQEAEKRVSYLEAKRYNL